MNAPKISPTQTEFKQVLTALKKFDEKVNEENLLHG